MIGLQQAAVTWVINQPTLLKGVYYKTHREIVLQYCLWYGLTVAQWGDRDTEPTRAREWRHYLEAVGILRRV